MPVAYSADQSATTGVTTVAYSADQTVTTLTAGTAPSAPTGLSAGAVSSARIDLSWTDASTDETGFEVERSVTGSGGPWFLLVTKSANAVSHQDGTVSPSTSYWYRVRAVNTFGQSGYSNTASASTPAAPIDPPPPPAATLLAALQVLIALDTRPTEVPVWTDVTAWVRGVSWRRGRDSELSEVTAGTGRLLLDNRDRRFDPTHAGGPYYGKLKKLRRVRLRATWDAVAYDAFTAYAEDWNLRWEGPQDAVVEVPLVDGFAVLAAAQSTDALPVQTADQRVHALLDEAAWTIGQGWLMGHPQQSILGVSTVLGSPGDRLLSVCDSPLAAVAAAGPGQERSVLAEILLATRSEQGLFFVDRSGRVRLRSRHELQQSGAGNPLAVFGSDAAAGELRYTGGAIDAAGGPHYNRVRVSRPDTQTVAVAQNDASIFDYFPRVLDLATALASDEEALWLAQAMVAKYAQPVPRVEALDLDPVHQPALVWPQLLQRDLGDPVLVRKRPPGGGAVLEQRCRLEGEEVAYEAGGDTARARWAFRWRLAPTGLEGAPWVMGDAARSILGTSTRLLQ